MTRRALELLVFGLVGASATTVYFGVANILYRVPPLHGHPASAAFVASVASVLWSYAGHHRFTFRKTGSHHFYLPRFVGISLMLSAMAVCGTYFATESYGVDYQLATLGVTISYPLASFALNRSWVFVERNPEAMTPFKNGSARQSDKTSIDMP
jgi:putative flippase GtrA